MKETNQKIIDSVIRKAKIKCPESLDLVAMYGSVCIGDEHEKSDLDLLILINDDNGWQLSDCFILDDEQIGYDIYCTTWQMLESDAECAHAHISKLMDSKIIYAANDTVTKRLDQLKKSAAEILKSKKRYVKVGEIADELRKVYADAMLADSIGELRAFAANMISLSLDIVMLSNGKYFKRGIKRTFEELEGLDLPYNFIENIDKLISAQNMSDIRCVLTELLRSVIKFTKQNPKKAQPSKETLSGTYEEIFSNWKNKMAEAVQRGDKFSSFMNMASFQLMLADISSEIEIADINIMNDFKADDLRHNAEIFDDMLDKYRNEYEKVGLDIRHFSDIDEFVRNYLS